MQGFELSGRQLRVGLVGPGSDKFSSDSSKTMQQQFGEQQRGSDFSGYGGRGQQAGGSGNFDHAGTARQGDKAGGASALDDSDVVGVNFANYSRDKLMKNLARIEDPTEKTGSATKVQKKLPSEPVVSRCLIIKHVWTAET